MTLAETLPTAIELTRTALVVDDDDDARETAARAIAPAGYGVIEATNAEQALEAVRSHSFDYTLLPAAPNDFNPHLIGQGSGSEDSHRIVRR